VHVRTRVYIFLSFSPSDPWAIRSLSGSASSGISSGRPRQNYCAVILDEIVPAEKKWRESTEGARTRARAPISSRLLVSSSSTPFLLRIVEFRAVNSKTMHSYIGNHRFGSHWQQIFQQVIANSFPQRIQTASRRCNASDAVAEIFSWHFRVGEEQRHYRDGSRIEDTWKIRGGRRRGTYFNLFWLEAGRSYCLVLPEAFGHPLQFLIRHIRAIQPRLYSTQDVSYRSSIRSLNSRNARSLTLLCARTRTLSNHSQ